MPCARDRCSCRWSTAHEAPCPPSTARARGAPAGDACPPTPRASSSWSCAEPPSAGGRRSPQLRDADGHLSARRPATRRALAQIAGEQRATARALRRGGTRHRGDRAHAVLAERARGACAELEPAAPRAGARRAARVPLGLLRGADGSGADGRRCHAALEPDAVLPGRQQGPGRAHRHHRRRHRHPPAVLRGHRLQLPARLPEGAVEGRQRQGDRGAVVRAPRQRATRAHGVRSERLRSRNARRRHRGGRVGHHGDGRRRQGAEPLGGGARRLPRQLPRADDPDSDLRARRQRGRDRARHRPRRRGRHGRAQPLPRRARGRAGRRSRRARDRRRRARGSHDGRRGGQRGRRGRVRHDLLARQRRSCDHRRRRHERPHLRAPADRGGQQRAAVPGPRGARARPEQLEHGAHAAGLARAAAPAPRPAASRSCTSARAAPPGRRAPRSR